VLFGGARFHVPDMATLAMLYPGVVPRNIAASGARHIPLIPADDTLLREESGAIWVVYGGARFHVPDVATLERLFKNRPQGRLWTGAVGSIPLTPVNGTLLREGDAAIWVIYGGARFHVPDMATLGRLFKDQPAAQLWDGAANQIPLAPMDGTLLREDEAIWVVYGGARFHVPDMAPLAQRFGGRPMGQLWNGASDGIATVPVDGTLLREGDTVIWVVYGGARFHVPDMATLARLFGDKPAGQLWNGAVNGISLIPRDGTQVREENSSQRHRFKG
jgi:hypothetical protein